MTAMVSHYGTETTSLFAGLVARFNSWNARRITRDELNNLSDRELDDIGLSRYDIPNVLRTI